LTSAEEVIRMVASSVVPTHEEEDRLDRLARSTLERTRRASARYPEVKDAILGGSFAKGTWLPRNADIDIFVRMDDATPEPRFEQVGLAVGAQATAGYPRGKKYAQHPYTEATIDGVRVNIVPCYAVVDRRWKSVADRSPFHVALVKRLPRDQKTQVRLLKTFMKVVSVYGAEIETQGFSGYVAEVLIMRHKTALEVLRYFADFSRASSDRPFTLPDPVDPGRDLAIAVSEEKLGRMVLASREFLRRPREACFVRMTGRARPSLRRSLISVVFAHPPLSEDTLWGELRKTMKHIVRHVDARGFKIARAIPASNNSDRSAFLFIPEFTHLPRIEQRVGPTVDLRKETTAFVTLNRKKANLVWVDDEARVRLLKRREYTSLAVLLGDVARGRVGSIGASREMARGMAKSARVLTGRQLATAARSEKWLARGISEIVSDAIGTRAS
jgi:tRNA nucleotidyltransferase (CCA-adding enzyme)